MANILVCRMQSQNDKQINTQGTIPDGESSLSCAEQASKTPLARLLERLSKRLPVRHIRKVNPDGTESPYLQRFAIYRGKRVGLYLHNFVDRDQDTEMHDHPWHALSLILCGSYIERRLRSGLEVTERRVSLFNWLRPDRFHMISEAQPGTWSLMIRFRRVKGWGFIGAMTNGQASYRPVEEDTDTNYRPATGKHVI
jgi:hypothetical protein